MKKFALLLTILVSLGALTGCGGSSKESAATDTKAPLKIGVSAGPHAEIMDNVKKLAAKEGLAIEVVEFNDYVTPNIALNQGEIFANSMQHAPYLAANLKKEPSFKLVEVFKTVNFPMAVYSKKLHKGDAIPDGSTIAIPNDPSNAGRAILTLVGAGLIKVKDSTNVVSSVADITDNPHGYKFLEVDAAAVPRSMDDVTAAVVNANYAIPAGLNPSSDALFVESTTNPYVNIFVAKEADAGSEKIAQLKKLYQSEANKKFILEHFKGTIQPGW